MAPSTVPSTHHRGPRPLTDLLVRIAGRPILLISFALYQREVRRAPMPRDESTSSIEGPDVDRLAFLGDITAAGYGVVTHSIATPAQVAQHVTRADHRGLHWHVVTDLSLTAGQILASRVDEISPSDAVVVMLGVTDVLFMTTPADWSTALEGIVERLRSRSGSSCRIVFVGLPALEDYWRITWPAKQLIRHQSRLLDEATRALAARLPGASFAPFPDWEPSDVKVGELFSWRAMHDARARDLAPLVVEALGEARATSGV